MSALFCDSFDHYNTATLLGDKWGLRGAGSGTAATDVGAYGRLATQGLRLSKAGAGDGAWVQRAVANLATGIIGFALKGTGADLALVQFMDNATVQCAVYLRSDGRLEARDGTGAVIGTGTAIMSSTVHKYVEVKATIHATTGTIEVYVDETLDIDTGGNDDTTATANAFMTAIRLGEHSSTSATYNYDIDDVYICDTLGGALDDFQGDLHFQYLAATGAGTNTDFTPSASTNVSNVDDVTPDEDTTNNGSDTPGDVDTFVPAALSGTGGTIPFLAVVNRFRKEDAGPRTMRNRLFLASAVIGNVESADITPTTAYSYAQSIHPLDGDGAAWDPTDLPEVGYEVQA